ncbi:MAG: outer membrane beta-barrel family protein [Muribaculaceae bacterium]|nr:outer membrane beta-barrel family protein [Muribaculaceae bacterium]
MIHIFNKSFIATIMLLACAENLHAKDDFSKELKEFTVIGSTNHMKLKPDGYIYDVENDSTLRNKWALDIFRQIPTLDVNLNGDVLSMQNKQLVYKLNGVTDPWLADMKNFLLSLSSNYVKRIEFTNNPNGDNPNLLEVNIITKGRIEGYQVNATAWGKDTGISASLWGLTKINNFTISGLYGPSLTRGHNQSETVDEWRYASFENYYLNSKSNHSGYKTTSHNVEIDMSYQFSDFDFLNIYGRALCQWHPHKDQSTTTSIYNQNEELMAQYENYVNEKYTDGEYSASCSYEHLIGHRAEGGKLYVGYQFYHRPKTINTLADYNIIFCEDNNLLPYFNQYNRKEKIDETTHNLLVEWRRNINPNNSVYLSGEYRYRYDHHGDSLAAPQWERVNLSQHFVNVSASYKFSKRNYLIRGGVNLRNYSDMIEATGSKQNYDWKRNSFILIPSVSATYVPNNFISLEIAYALNSSVPDISVMNPTVFQVSPEQKYYGNPNLRPEKNNTVSMEANLNFRRVYVGVTLTGQWSSDLILQHSWLDELNVVNTTYDNLTSRSTYSVSPFITWNAGRNTRVRGNFSADYISYKHHNSGMQYRGNITVSQSLPWRIYMELSGRYNSPWVGLQGNGGQNYGYSILLARAFLQERLRINLYAGNFVPIYYKRKYVTEDDNYKRIMNLRQFQPNFELKISYRFGKLRARVWESESSTSKRQDIKTTYDE